MDQDANVNERDIEHGPEWKVSIAPEQPGVPAAVVLQLSENGRTFKHQLDAKTATKISNALIVEAERASSRPLTGSSRASPIACPAAPWSSSGRANGPHPEGARGRISKDGHWFGAAFPLPLRPRCFETARTEVRASSA